MQYLNIQTYSGYHLNKSVDAYPSKYIL